ncbi:glycosyltransferase [Alteromonas sediminis]|uniref:Glycosyltransferase n=1 Tax=Alteromonas sediminis TaxID=2259342 RepID=A0A3N5YAE6_9ALTE|nr:glycosyltransferase [Alteromonas sediminis]RPJ68509.1 glycosyltransferase [Alteromonas sediminis]
MKVLRIVRTMDPRAGGVSEAIDQLAKVQADRKWEMDVLCFDESEAQWNQDKSYKVISLGKAFSTYGIHFRYLKWLFDNVKGYDLVIFDGLWQFFLVGGYVIKFFKVPFCVYTHGMLDPYFNKNRAKYLKKLPFWFLVERNILNFSKKVIFTCEEEKNLAKLSFPKAKFSSFIVTLGVDGERNLARTDYSDESNASERRFGLFLSRVHPKKGLDLLLKCFTSSECIPKDFDLVIAGPCADKYKDELLKLVPSNFVDRVHWVGMLEGDKKWYAFKKADFFVLPSHQENFGIVVAEALSVATPVLITNKVNIWREVDKYSCGFVENDDLEGIQKLITNWFGLSDHERNVMRSKAEECFRDRFSIQAAISSFEQLLTNIGKSRIR